MTAVHPQLSPRCVQWRGICRSKTSGKPILTICPMSRATSSTRSVIITKSLCPRIALACCASCTLMEPSSPKLKLRGREHSNCTPWAQRTVDPKLSPPEIKLLDFLYGEWGVVLQLYLGNCTPFVVPICGDALGPAAPHGPSKDTLHALLGASTSHQKRRRIAWTLRGT